MTSYHAFLGCSMDGFIAGPNGELDWLVQFEDRLGDSGYDAFFSSIDALVMGRTSYEAIRRQSPDIYDGAPVYVLSRTLPVGPQAVMGRSTVTVCAELSALRSTLAVDGVRRAYVDGGRTVQTFVAEGLLSDIIITRVPVLVGDGVPLFGPVPHPVPAELIETRELGAGAVQSTYRFPVTSR